MPDHIALLSLIFTLRPLNISSTPPHLGRAAHALLLDGVRWSNSALAEELHDGTGLRPFTASDLTGYSRKRGLSPDQVGTLRMTALTAPVAQALLAAVHEGPLQVGSELHLTESVFRIEAVTSGADANSPGHPWAAAMSYEDLAAPWLLSRANPEARVRLQFASPTTFKSGGRNVPVPLPNWVFGSLLERWNTFAPIALPGELQRFVEECLALSVYQLHSRMIPVKDGGLRIGALGWARYVATNRDRYWLSLVNLLADYAFFTGVGAGTTMGLGQCRRIPDPGVTSPESRNTAEE